MAVSLSCTRCGISCETGITCDECELEVIERLLASPSWLKVRGPTSGDLPGETLADTMRREARGLRLILA
jgi:hypothetical protein